MSFFDMFLPLEVIVKRRKLKDTANNRQALSDLGVDYTISLTEYCLFVNVTNGDLKAIKELLDESNLQGE